MSLQPRAVIIHRRSEYDEMIERHGTRQQAAFFLRSRGRSLDDLVRRHEQGERARAAVAAAVPTQWRRADLERDDLARFLFAPEDVIAVVGQDGLVANVAKYLSGQPVVGINPDPDRNPGILVPHDPTEAEPLLVASVSGAEVLERRTMITATTDDGQQLSALNELYLGHASHQSARYRIGLPDGSGEHHSSSGLLAGTGTGATGWLRSAWTERHSTLPLPAPDAHQLCWFAREAWPSNTTGTSCTEGLVQVDEALTVRAESDELVCFGDGIEADALSLHWGQTISFRVSTTTLNLVKGRS